MPDNTIRQQISCVGIPVSNLGLAAIFQFPGDLPLYGLPKYDCKISPSLIFSDVVGELSKFFTSGRISYPPVLYLGCVAHPKSVIKKIMRNIFFMSVLGIPS